MNEPTTPATVEQPPEAPKPQRSPVERAIVWIIILVGLGVAGYEARAKFGYDWTLAALQSKLNEVDQSAESDAKFTYDQALTVASLAPTISDEEKMFGMRKTRTMKWPSIAKTYELKLILDEDNVLLAVETSEPPVIPQPEASPQTPEGDDITAGTGGAPGGGGGGPPMHDAQAGTSGPVSGGGPGGGAGGGPRGGGNQGLTGLLSNEAVVSELALSDQQKEKITAFAETMQAEGAGLREIFGKMRDASEEERQALREQIATIRAEIDSKTLAGLSDILDESQLTRLQQIDWQQQGARALTSQVVMEKLELSAEQQAKLTELSENYNNERRELGRDGSPEDRQALTDKYNTEFAGVLTEEQTTAWNELLGDKFDLPAPAGGGGGRPARPE